jgi:hypothetical protein
MNSSNHLEMEITSVDPKNIEVKESNIGEITNMTLV